MTEKILDLNREKTIFWTLTGILLLCFAFYTYSINVTVRNVVQRENLESEISKISLDISNKEFSYISKRNSVSMQLAYAMGFKDVTDKTYTVSYTHLRAQRPY